MAEFVVSKRIFLHVVHGFAKREYSVLEGETVDIVFQRDVKGTTILPLLSLQGSITSEGDENGKF